MSPKYNILNFTESYRQAEHRHTVVLPALMGLVVLVSFWLVAKTRPTVRKAKDVPAAIGTGKSTTEIALSSPPKIKLDIDFEKDLNNIPVIDPGFSIDSGKGTSTGSEKLKVPVARVIKATPLSADGLPLIRLPNSENRFTPWMTPSELNQYILSLNQGQEISFWDRGHWIIAVEGRWANNQQEYRIIYERTPKNTDYEWRYRIAQSPEIFARNIAQLERDGFTLVQSQAFETPARTTQYQAVWQKLD